jgi:hypothetical protein
MSSKWSVRRKLNTIVENIQYILARINFLSENVSLVSISTIEGTIHYIQRIDLDDELSHVDASLLLLEEYKKLLNQEKKRRQTVKEVIIKFYLLQ